MALDIEASEAPGALSQDAIQAATDCTVKLTTGDGTPRSQSSILTDIGRTHHLFHDEGGDAYARVRVGHHAEVFATSSVAYRDCLARDYYRLTGKGASRNAIPEAISTLTAMAKHDGPCEPVWLRTGAAAGSLVIDLGDKDWQCVEVLPFGWHVTRDRIVNFRRSGKATALPHPTTADFSRLWRYVNVEACDRPLIAGWLLGALRPSGPYPILLLIGEQGTGKSGASRTLKRLTDPSAVLLRSPPRDEKDLLVSALSSWVLALDNLSGAKPELSDALCRIATGGGLAGRTLYTNADETLLEVKRPVIMNGIDDLASRPDLAERCLHIELPPLRSRATEAELEARFAEDGGAIFAALLDGLARALRDHHIPRDRLPRMADFAQWAAAGMSALGFTADEFLDAYRANQAGAIEAGLETSALGSVLRRFLAREGGNWKGSSTELLALLNRAAQEELSAPGWPRSTKGLVTILRRLAPSLRHVGIDYKHDRSSDSRFLQFVCTQPRQASQASSVTRADDGMTHLTHGQPVGTAAEEQREEFDL